MKRKHSQRGFTLMETLVAIAILLIAVVGPMSIIGRSLPQSAYARDHAIAINLAQEGIEAVRQKRDSNMINDWNGIDTAWDEGIVDNNNYFVDPRSSPMLISCGVSACAPSVLAVRRNPAGWYYQTNLASTDSTTNFQRYVLISSASSHEKQILSFVVWFDSMKGIHFVAVYEYILGINS